MSKQVESLPAAPEELLRFCENELQRLQARRAKGANHRAAVLAASLLFLIVGGMGAFFFLFTKLQDLPHPGHAPGAEVATSAPGAH